MESTQTRAGFERDRAEQTLLYVTGVVLVASGLFHMVVWAVDGGSWSGPLSLRKPILFGLSAGVTVLSVAWLVGKLSPRRGDVWLMAAFCIAMLLEVGLISMQQEKI